MNQSSHNVSHLNELEQLRREYAELKAACEKNITVQKQTEESLRQSEHKFFVLFEKSAFPASLSRLPEGTIVNVNEAFEREFGFTKQEAVGKTTFELGINPDAEGRKRILEALNESNSVRNQEMVLHSKSGEKWYYETNIDIVVINGEKYLLNTTQNISEYKRAKNKLKNSEARYKAIFESTGTATLIVDEDTTILMANNECYEMFGYDLSQLSGQKWTQFVAPESLQEMIRNHQLRRNNPQLAPRKYEVILLNSKGEKRNAVLNANMIPGTKQSVVSMLDITERKQAEEELRKNKSNLEEYFENDISADYVASVSGEIISCNKTFLSLFGFEKKSETEKFDITELYKNPEDKKQVIRLVKKQRKVENHEVEFISKEGKTIHALINAIGIFGKHGKLEQIRGYVVDITDRINAEKLLRISETKYKNLSETVNVITWEYDMINDSWNYVSPQSYTILGYKPEEWENFEWWAKNIYHQDRQQSVDYCIAESQIKRDHVFEYRFTKKDGTIIWLRDSVVVIVEDNTPKLLRGIMMDITEQQQTKELLLKSEEKYRLLFANNPQPMWIYDLETLAFLEVNQAAVNHYGYSKEEFLSMTLKDIRPAEDIPALLDDIQKTHTNLNSAGEWRHMKKNGEIIDVEITSHSVIFNNRNARHILINDITERKFYEEELLKLSRAVEQSPASVIVTDLDGNIEYVNPKTTEISGYTIEELIGKNPRILSSGEKPKSEYQQLWNTISSRKEWNGEFHNKKKNGELYWESASISPIINEKQEIINYVAIKEDITERKRFEDTRKLLLEISQLTSKHVTLNSFLAEVHKKIKKIIRADNFYVALHNEKDNTLTFPYHVDEYDKVELNKPYDFRGGLTDYVLQTNQSSIFTPEYRIEIEKDGSMKAYGNELSVWLGVPFKTKKSDKLNGVIAIQDYQNLESYSETDKTIMEIIARNIGSFIERIEYLEELVQAKEKAEESDRLKSAFLANMSHEIRTPMNGILGFTDLLLNPDLSSKEKESFIKIVHKSGQRMLNTVTDIVEISKIEAGLVQLNITETDVNARMDELFRFFRPEAENKGLKLSMKILLPSETKNISTDQNKLDSILSNLIKNAIKYTDSGTINMGCRMKDDVVEFYIKDTGIGIATNRLEAIFNRFEQADISDTRAFQGSGLGLAIAKSYVEMLGGKIWVESEEGLGSTFYFTLPLTNDAKENPVVLNELPAENENNKVLPVTRGLKILIAEDHKPSRAYISLIVNDVSAEILETATGIETVELCRNNPDIDLVLMDIQMPDMNGYAATREIRKFNKNVVIIAQTAFALSGDREKALEAGCNDYISKPIKRGVLLEMIQKYFRE